MHDRLTPFEKFIGSTVAGFIVGLFLLSAPFFAGGLMAGLRQACSAACGEHWTYDNGCVCLEVADGE